MQPEGSPQRRHKRHEEEEHEQHLAHDESNWLVSYADMMTLLFGFFVLMYAFSRIDNEKFEVVSKDLVKYFGGKLVDQPGSPAGIRKLTQDALQEMKLQNLQQSGDGVVDVVAENDKIRVTLASDFLFKSGSAAPSPEAVQIINQVYGTIKKYPIETIEVEGHTDGDAISTPTFPSNWELSSARASSVVRILENLKVQPSKLKATGYGNTQPTVSEAQDASLPSLAERKAKNRRVVLSLKLGSKDRAVIESLEQEGVSIVVPNAPAHTADVEAPTAQQSELLSLQDRYQQVAQRLKDANDRLKEAKELEKKARELEKLTQKAADMEKKVLDVENKAQRVIQETTERLNPNAGKPQQQAPAPKNPDEAEWDE